MSECPDVDNSHDGLTRSGTECFISHSCTHMAAVNVQGLSLRPCIDNQHLLDYTSHLVNSITLSCGCYLKASTAGLTQANYFVVLSTVYCVCLVGFYQLLNKRI